MRGFNVKCCLCGEEDTVVVSIGDTSAFSCTACSQDFTADDVKEFIAAWTKVLAWLGTAPKRDA